MLSYLTTLSETVASCLRSPRHAVTIRAATRIVTSSLQKLQPSNATTTVSEIRRAGHRLQAGRRKDPGTMPAVRSSRNPAILLRLEHTLSLKHCRDVACAFGRKQTLVFEDVCVCYRSYTVPDLHVTGRWHSYCLAAGTGTQLPEVVVPLCCDARICRWMTFSGNTWRAAKHKHDSRVVVREA